jgi:hypothetical protein
MDMMGKTSETTLRTPEQSRSRELRLDADLRQQHRQRLQLAVSGDQEGQGNHQCAAPDDGLLHIRIRRPSRAGATTVIQRKRRQEHRNHQRQVDHHLHQDAADDARSSARSPVGCRLSSQREYMPSKPETRAGTSVTALAESGSAALMR